VMVLGCAWPAEARHDANGMVETSWSSVCVILVS
jgi:hypothetical protein